MIAMMFSRCSVGFVFFVCNSKYDGYSTPTIQCNTPRVVVSTGVVTQPPAKDGTAVQYHVSKPERYMDHYTKDGLLYDSSRASTCVWRSG